jgi:DNA polymerase (family 10)
MDVVIGSVHSAFAMEADAMTARLLRAIENPYLRILGHPTGRILLRRDPYAYDMDTVMRRCAELGVAVEHNAAPARADLNDLQLRKAKALGCKISVNTDAHSTAELDFMRFGVTQLRRAWLTGADVLNTFSAEMFLSALRPRPTLVRA